MLRYLLENFLICHVVVLSCLRSVVRRKCPATASTPIPAENTDRVKYVVRFPTVLRHFSGSGERLTRFADLFLDRFGAHVKTLRQHDTLVRRKVAPDARV